MDRAQKSEQISGLAKTLSEPSVIVVARNHGLSVAQATDLRNKMRQAGASFKVTKNRLARIALEGTPYQPIGDMLTGPTG
ncbi:MAG: 50S ribosomal protein L10, partial [Sandarakinorhabdus sp.]|nr:50S ribosomal protein L10 [Sandarakinorhabdus sp.]